MENFITFFSNRKEIVLSVGAIMYVVAQGNKVGIHTVGGEVYEARMTLCEIENILGEAFIKVKRNTIVAAEAIECVTDSVHLKNGEELPYPPRQKKHIIERLTEKRN